MGTDRQEEERCVPACGSKLNESDNAKYIANASVVVEPTSSNSIFPGVMPAPATAPKEGALIATACPSVGRLVAGAGVVRPPGNDTKRGSLDCDLVVLSCAVLSSLFNCSILYVICYEFSSIIIQYSNKIVCTCV